MTSPSKIEEPIFSSPRGAFSFFRQRPSTGDFVGGISVAMVLIPQSIAYAAIAGLPPKSGLLSATLPLIVAAPFVSCPWLQTGPTALTSLLTFGALASFSGEDPIQFMKLAGMLALVVGTTRLLMGLFQLGRLIQLLQTPVVLGITTAASLLIIAAQINHALGTTNLEKNVIHCALSALADYSHWSMPAIMMTVLCGSIIIMGRTIHRLFPSFLFAAVIAILVSGWTDYEAPVVGTMPGNFVSLSFDFPWSSLAKLVLPGIAIALVGFVEPTSISMTLTREAGINWNASRELIGGGFANVTSALVGGYAIGGSFSRTSVNRLAGATTSWSGLITGIIVLLFLPFTHLLERLPRAALAAIIILAVIRLIKIREIWHLFRHDRHLGYVAIVTTIATLITAPHIEYGVMIGIVFSMIKWTRPHCFRQKAS